MKPKAFIPAWLNQAKLTQAEFRVYCCLAARADIKTGIAWPKAETIASDCSMAKRTVWKSVKSLAEKQFIRKKGKKFADSNRYQILIPIDANEAPIANEPIDANEAPPIGAPFAPPIDANEAPGRVTKKSNQGKQTKAKIPYTPSMEATALASFFKSSLPPDMDIGNKWKTDWPKVFDALIEKGRDPDEIRAIIKWGRADSFWRSNFLSPAKLNKRDPSGVKYYDIFKAKMATPNSSQKPQTTAPPNLDLGDRKGEETQL